MMTIAQKLKNWKSYPIQSRSADMIYVTLIDRGISKIHILKFYRELQFFGVKIQINVHNMYSEK